MNVLIIPEDHHNDQFILEPIIRRLVKDAGKPHARIAVCTNPRMRGVQDALSGATIQDIIETYPMVHIFVVVVDRDGKSARTGQLIDLEKRSRKHLKSHQTLIAVAAVEELEVWALASEKIPPKVWSEIRRDHHPKEAHFEPLVQRRGLRDSPGGGRRVFGNAAAKEIERVKARCAEVGELAERLADLLGEK